MSEEKKKNYVPWIISVILLLVVMGLLLFGDSPVQERDDYYSPVNDSICDETYLGNCYDEESMFYQCNVIDGKCDAEEFELGNKIKYLEDNDIKIYGTTTCPWCKKLYEDFGKYGPSVVQEGIYNYCNQGFNPDCHDVESVPTWKKDGEIVHEGYFPLNEVEERL